METKKIAFTSRGGITNILKFDSKELQIFCYLSDKITEKQTLIVIFLAKMLKRKSKKIIL